MALLSLLDKSLVYDKLNDYKQRQTLDTRFEQAFVSRVFYREAANKANRLGSTP